MNCRSLIPLGLRIMHLVSLFCFARSFLGKKYFKSHLLISCIWIAVVPPKVATIKSYSCSALPCSKVLMKAIFPTMYKVPVPTSFLSKFVGRCKISYGEPDLKFPFSNSYVLEVVMFGLCQSLILVIFLSLISTSFLINGIGG